LAAFWAMAGLKESARPKPIAVAAQARRAVRCRSVAMLRKNGEQNQRAANVSSFLLAISSGSAAMVCRYKAGRQSKVAAKRKEKIHVAIISAKQSATRIPAALQYRTAIQIAAM
jgi:hypothetical protein